MAENLILVELKAEGQQSVANELDKVAQSIDEVGNEFTNLNKAIELSKKKLSTLKEGSAEFKKLQQEIKASEIAVQNFGKGTQSLKSELKGMKAEIANLSITLGALEKAGHKGTDQFKNLEAQMLRLRGEAGELEDILGDVSDEVSRAGSDTKNLDKTVGAVQAVGGAFQAVMGVQALFGSENEDLQKTLVKLNAVMAITTGAQQFFSEALKKDSLLYPIVTRLQQLWSVAIGTSTGALRVLRVALASLGIGLIIAGITLLVQNFDKVKEKIISIFPSLEGLGGKIKTFVNEGLLSLVNGFIETYNKSLFLRNSLEGIADIFISIKDIGVLAFKQIGNGISTLFNAIKAGLSGGDPFKILKDGFSKNFENIAETGKKIVKNFTEKDLPNQLEKVKSIDIGKLFSGGEKAGEKIAKDVKSGVEKEVVGAFDALQKKISDTEKLLLNLKTEQVEGTKDNVIQIKSLIIELEHYKEILEKIQKYGNELPPLPLENLEPKISGVDVVEDKVIEDTKIKVANATDKITDLNVPIGLEIKETTKDKIKKQIKGLFGFERGDDAKVKAEKTLNAIGAMENGITNIINQASAIRAQNEIAELENKKKRGLISEKKYQEELAKIRRKEAERAKKQAVFEALLNIPLAVLSGFKSGGLAGAIFAGVLASAQLAIVASTPLPKFRDGGLIGGNLHEQGGTTIEAERGEFVMKKETVKRFGVGFMKDINNQKIPNLNTNGDLKSNMQKILNNEFSSLSKKIDEFNLNFQFMEMHLKESKLNSRMANDLLKQIANNKGKGYA